MSNQDGFLIRRETNLAHRAYHLIAGASPAARQDPLKLLYESLGEVLLLRYLRMAKLEAYAHQDPDTAKNLADLITEIEHRNLS